MSDGRVGAIFWAGGLVVTGLLLLLFNFGLLVRFEPLAQYVVAGCFAVVGIGFFGSYLSDRKLWWRLMPGWTLLSVAGMVLFSTIPGLSPLLIPAVLFVGLALAFGNIFLVNRSENWWAIIPGGFLLVLSVVIGLNTATDNLEMLFAILVDRHRARVLGVARAGTGRGAMVAAGPWPGADPVRPIHHVRRQHDRASVVALVARGADRNRTGHGMADGCAATQAGEAICERSSWDCTGRQDRERRRRRLPVREEPGVLGEYSEPAPGASVEVCRS